MYTCSDSRRTIKTIFDLFSTLQEHNGTIMKPQYPDHAEFENMRPAGVVSNFMSLLSSTGVSLSFVACVAYIVALLFTASQCTELIVWGIGKPNTRLPKARGREA